MESPEKRLLHTFIDRARERDNAEALVCKDQSYSFAELCTRMDQYAEWLEGKRLGRVIGLQSAFSFDAVALLLAILNHGAVVALIPASATDLAPYITGGGLDTVIQPGEHSPTLIDGIGGQKHSLIQTLQQEGRAGFIVFSSGSSGAPKAILHDAERFLGRYRSANKPFRTLMFLLFDHIAGLDTMFYTVFSGGVMIVPEKRDPESICQLVDRHRVEVLPASPTFFRLLLLSGAHRHYQLGSLKILTYGSEPMNESTLQQLAATFPALKILQKYGTSEFGAPPSRSKGPNELWMKLHSDNFQTRIEDGMLWVKSQTAMLGYLNAPQPEKRSDWICTGDRVIVDGDWLRILGRESDMINVGGEKVFPSEVEAVIEQVDGVLEAAVYGEAHPFLGQCACAMVRTADPEGWPTLRKTIRQHCRNVLPPYKIPTKIGHTVDPLVGERQKKYRKPPVE